MRALVIVWLKEMSENLRDRRTLLSALVIGPLFGPVMFALMIGLLLEKTVSEVDEKVVLAVTGSARAPNLMRFLEEHAVRSVHPLFPAAGLFEQDEGTSICGRYCRHW